MLRRPPISPLFPYTTLFRSTRFCGGARPIERSGQPRRRRPAATKSCDCRAAVPACRRSEEHTSELQSLRHLVCRLLLEKKKKNVNLTGEGMHKRHAA